MLAIELAKGDKYCADGTAVLRVAPRKGDTLTPTLTLDPNPSPEPEPEPEP